MIIKKEEEVNQVTMERPHVVILGAGASYASFSNGDKNGIKLPLMNNFIEILELQDLLKKTGIEFESHNFEDIYDKIVKTKGLEEIQKELEDKVYHYFNNLDIVDKPTVYDHLLLSLREKDVIATFNWDPFLFQAYYRNEIKGFKLPKLLFLHGNVAIGYCEKDKIAGVNGHKCKKCMNIFNPTKLLYPISEKNYHHDNFISLQWELLRNHLESAFMVTIFGYGAPVSDISAIELMKKAWGNIDNRNMEQLEIIDIREEEELQEVWNPFIHSHHVDFRKSFYDSFIANHPRRTGEAYLNQYIYCKFIENNPIPKELDFDRLWKWYQQFLEAENNL